MILRNCSKTYSVHREFSFCSISFCIFNIYASQSKTPSLTKNGHNYSSRASLKNNPENPAMCPDLGLYTLYTSAPPRVRRACIIIAPLGASSLLRLKCSARAGAMSELTRVPGANVVSESFGFALDK